VQLDPEQFEEIYPLSPTQQAMLAYSLCYPANSGVYHHQFCYTLCGDLDISLFERSWQQIVARHSILRTAFLTEPVQVVKRHASLRLKSADWRGLSSIEQRERLEKFLKEDRGHRFEISEPPLMRLALFRLSENRYQFIQSAHHVILDGWSLSILLREVVTCYEALSRGEEPNWTPAPPFRDYIAWLKGQQQQKKSEAEAYWRGLLKDFTTPTPLRVNASLRRSHGQEQTRGRLWTQLSRDETAKLQAFAREYRLTLNTLAQAGWGILLSRHSGTSDVVFGSVMSVRPSTIPGIESMVGPLINTLPVRLRLAPGDTVLALLKNLHRQQVETSQYDYSSLINVLEWSGVPRGGALFDAMFAFENYPENPIRGRGGRFEMYLDRSVGRTNNALAVAVLPGLELSVVIGFNAARFDTVTVTHMLEDFRTLLSDIVANPAKRVVDLQLSIEVAAGRALE
jgi:Condensation domain